MANSDPLDLVFAHAAARPTHPAVAGDDGYVDYATLARRVRSFAAVFERWEAPRVLIALRLGADAYAAMLAAGLAGGFYTAVNLASPRAKLRLIASQLRPDVIVGEGEAGAALAAEVPEAFLLCPARLADAAPSAGRPPRHEIAYVIFTSGSTGQPKGVVIPRRALEHYVCWMQGAGMFEPDDRASQYASIGFDLSVMEIYGALCGGATLFPVTGAGDRLFPARMIKRNKITVWTSVPSVLGLMIRANGVTRENLRSLRLLNFCGEPLLPEHLRVVFAACPQAVVQNTYGPTETTVSMTSLILTAADHEGACRSSAALGVAISGMAMHLVGGRQLDEGEIVVTGPQLADGYWQDPQRTAEVFRDVDIGGRKVRGYFTGDWAERHDGRVYFKERIDFQVKIRGVRIELDEIAAAIREAGWQEVCLMSRGGRLVAVVEDCAAPRCEARRLADWLRGRLEAEAVPEAIHVIDRMPRNENGKVDRQSVAAWLETFGDSGNVSQAR